MSSSQVLRAAVQLAVGVEKLAEQSLGLVLLHHHHPGVREEENEERKGNKFEKFGFGFND